MMVSKRKEKTEAEAEEIMKEEETNHSDHLRKKEYSNTCHWCLAHGFAS